MMANQALEQTDNRFPNMPQNVAIPTENVNQATTAIEAQRAVAEAQGKLQRLKKAVRLSSFLLKFKIDIRKRLFHEVTASLGGALEGIVCGGAAVDLDCARGFQSLGIDFLNGYGITECSPIVSVNRKKANRIGSVGQPISCNRISQKQVS